MPVKKDLVCDFDVRSHVAAVSANIDELNGYIDSLVEMYEQNPVKATEENKQACKKDLANLRKVKTQVKAKMSSVKKEILRPFTEINDQVNAALGKMEALETSMAGDIRRIEDEQKAKLIENRKFLVSEIVTRQKPEVQELVRDYWSEKWNNLTANDSNIKADMYAVCERTQIVLDLIRGHRHEAELLGCYRRTLDYTSVSRLKEQLEEDDARYERIQAQRMQEEAERQRQAEAERQRQAEADRQRQAEADRQRQAEAERQRQAEADRALAEMMPAPEPVSEPVQKPASEPAPGEVQEEAVLATFRLYGTIPAIRAYLDMAAGFGVQFYREGKIIKPTSEDKNRYSFR